MKKSSRPIRWLSLLILITFPGTLSAQMEQGGGKEEMTGGGAMMHKMMSMHGMDAGMSEMMKMMQSMSRLDLTLDQKKKIESLKLKHQKEAIPLLSKTAMAGVEIKELTFSDPVDLEKVKAKVKEKYAAMGDLEVSHLALTRQMKAILSPEQRQKIDSMMVETGPMMGMGGSSGKGKGERETKAAPKGIPKESEEAVPENADPHGH
jgi:Spy/CpxP family protein refolding chaperone